MFDTLLATITVAAANVSDVVLPEVNTGGGVTAFFENIQNLVYPAIIGGYLIYTAIRKAVKKIKDSEVELKKQDNAATILRNKKKFEEYAHDQSMTFMTNMKDICNRYRDQASPDRVHFLQLENGTVAITGVYNMYITSIAEDDRYSRLPRVYRYVNRIPYNRLSSLMELMRNMQAYDSEIVELNGENDESHDILRIFNELYSSKVGSCLALPIYDHEQVFVGSVLFDYIDTNYNGKEPEQQKKYLRELQISIHTILNTYNANLVKKRIELGLVIDDLTRRRAED